MSANSRRTGDPSRGTNAANVLELAVGILLIIAGLILVIVRSTNTATLLSGLSVNVGYSLVAAGIGSVVVQLILGRRAANTLTQVKDTVADTVEELQTRLEKVSGVGFNANAIGIEGIARDRDDAAFRDMNLLQRLRQLVESSREVDILLYEDHQIFSAGQQGFWNGQSLLERVRNKSLRLRILLSAEDDPTLDLLQKWAPFKNYFRDGVSQANTTLHGLEAIQGEVGATIVKRFRQQVVPFTLIRALLTNRDEYLYIMFFIPGANAGPIIEIKKHEDDAGHRGHRSELFVNYKKYFQDLWDMPEKS